MSVQRAPDGTILLGETCPVEDADTLLRLLSHSPDATVDWRGCLHAHSAMVQVLLALRPPLLGPPAGRFLRVHVAALVGAAPG